MILGWQKRSKIALPAEKKNAECREETHRPPHVVNLLKRNDNYVVRQSREYLHPSSAGVVL